MTYTICESCIDIKDKACVDECPVDCIYEGPRMLYIHPDECVDCGACEPVCPVTAIFYEDDVPAEWKQFTPINAEWFNDDRQRHRIAGRGGPGRPERRGPSGGRRLARRRLTEPTTSGLSPDRPRCPPQRRSEGRRRGRRGTTHRRPAAPSTQARPPCSSAKRATSVRPTPTPGECCRGVRALTEGLEDRLRASRSATPGPSSSTTISTPPSSRPDPHPHRRTLGRVARRCSRAGSRRSARPSRRRRRRSPAAGRGSR